jgi:Uma2 family endonuclease
MANMSRLSPEQVRFSLDEYLRIADAGLLDRIKTELLEGRIVDMAPQEDPHMAAVSRIMRLLNAVTDAEQDWLVVQGTLYLDDRSAPEPDFHLFNVPVMTPRERRPAPILVIEVSDTTYRKDRDEKTRIYARAGIEDYWIVNINQRRLEVYRQPINPTGNDEDWRYASVTHLGPGEMASMLKRPAVKLPVAQMLP